jgi:MFS transporter, DHA3 family, macrolide efflux protein
MMSNLLKDTSKSGITGNSSLWLLWGGELVSTAGSALTTLAASILVYRQTGSALSVSLMLLATALPSLLVGVFAGVMVDRFDRKKILVISN